MTAYEWEGNAEWRKEADAANEDEDSDILCGRTSDELGWTLCNACEDRMECKRYEAAVGAALLWQWASDMCPSMRY